MNQDQTCPICSLPFQEPLDFSKAFDGLSFLDEHLLQNLTALQVPISVSYILAASSDGQTSILFELHQLF